MSLTLTNTLTGELEPFEPADPEAVTLYYCGLTVSDHAHLGHARSWIHTDVIRRWLEHLGYRVRHVENFTDVNEKIVARVGEAGPDEGAIADRFIRSVLADMDGLNLRRASVRPRVTEHIDEIVELIESLLERGYAYEVDGSVYFDVPAFDGYGQLSEQAAADGESDDGHEHKRDPRDFALWKAGGVKAADLAAHRPDEAAPAAQAAEHALTFPSPWSEGRPGWHIECSAMATTHLDETFDLHVAGRDICFPHNENEIAQAVAGTDGEFARYWLHTGLLRTDEEKMSSSLGNFFLVSDALEAFGPNVIRVFMLASTYSADQQLSEAAIAEAEERWDGIRTGLQRGRVALSSDDARSDPDAELRSLVEDARTGFRTAMNDDFNTRQALSHLTELASGVRAHVSEQERYDYPGLVAAVEALETLGGDVFGLSFESSESDATRTIDALLDLILDVRERERMAGNYERADELRTDLESIGIVVEDTDDGPEAWIDSGE